jgi:serine/threonine protein kinase
MAKDWSNGASVNSQLISCSDNSIIYDSERQALDNRGNTVQSNDLSKAVLIPVKKSGDPSQYYLKVNKKRSDAGGRVSAGEIITGYFSPFLAEVYEYVTVGLNGSGVDESAYLMECLGVGQYTNLYQILDAIKCGSLSLDETDKARIALSALLGIRDLYRLGFAHCDIKPPNYFIATDLNGRYYVKLGDYDTALSTTTEAAQPFKAGTVCYCSPAIYTGLYRWFNTLHDIFSYGAVLYEIYTGERLFCEKNEYGFFVTFVNSTGDCQRLRFVDNSDFVNCRLIMRANGYTSQSAPDYADNSLTKIAASRINDHALKEIIEKCVCAFNLQECKGWGVNPRQAAEDGLVVIDKVVNALVGYLESKGINASELLPNELSFPSPELGSFSIDTVKYSMTAVSSSGIDSQEMLCWVQRGATSISNSNSGPTIYCRGFAHRVPVPQIHGCEWLSHGAGISTEIVYNSVDGYDYILIYSGLDGKLQYEIIAPQIFTSFVGGSMSCPHGSIPSGTSLDFVAYDEKNNSGILLSVKEGT